MQKVIKNTTLDDVNINIHNNKGHNPLDILFLDNFCLFIKKCFY